MKNLLKNEKFVSAALNTAIFVLLFFIFLQCGMFLNGYIKRSTEAEEIPFDMRLLSVSAQDAARALDAELLLPAQIAVSARGEAHTVVDSSAVIGDLYAELSPSLASCFAAQPKKESAALWDLTVSSSDVIYVRYYAALPYQILHAFAAASDGQDMRVRDASVISVEELCFRIVDGDAVVVVRGGTGVYSFRGETDLTTSDFLSYASAYADVFYPCVLSGGEASCLIKERISSRELTVQTGICGEILETETHFDAWCRRLLFNPDKLNYHVEPDGTAVYVESHGVLTCTDDRILYTAAEDGGVSVSKFCSVMGDVDVYTYLRAASAWISEVSAMNVRYTGGDAALRLTGVYSDGTSITLYFAQFAENLPIFTDGESTSFSMTFTGDRLTGMEWRTVFVQRQLTRRASFLESWSREALGTQRVQLAYMPSTDKSLLFAQWIAYQTAED